MGCGGFNKVTAGGPRQFTYRISSLPSNCSPVTIQVAVPWGLLIQ